MAEQVARLPGAVREVIVFIDETPATSSSPAAWPSAGAAGSVQDFLQELSRGAGRSGIPRWLHLLGFLRHGTTIWLSTHAGGHQARQALRLGGRCGIPHGNRRTSSLPR